MLTHGRACVCVCVCVCVIHSQKRHQNAATVPEPIQTYIKEVQEQLETVSCSTRPDCSTAQPLDCMSCSTQHSAQRSAVQLSPVCFVVRRLYIRASQASHVRISMLCMVPADCLMARERAAPAREASLLQRNAPRIRPHSAAAQWWRRPGHISPGQYTVISSLCATPFSSSHAMPVQPPIGSLYSSGAFVIACTQLRFWQSRSSE